MSGTGHPPPATVPAAIPAKAWTFVARVMKPVVRLALRLGFSADQISQFARKLAVDAAMEYPEFRPPHRKRAFLAHAAVVTGLSRKEVAKLYEMEDLQTAATSCQTNRSIRVLAGWRNDRRYRDPETGRPLASLPLKAAKGVSFHQLVREYGGDVPPRSVLDALIRSGAILQHGDTVELVRGFPTRAASKEEEMEFVGIILNDVLNTAEYDLRPGTEEPYLLREWYQVYVPEDRVQEARELIRAETWKFGCELDERLSELAHRTPRADVRYYRVGLGAFYVQAPRETDEAAEKLS